MCRGWRGEQKEKRLDSKLHFSSSLQLHYIVKVSQRENGEYKVLLLCVLGHTLRGQNSPTTRV